MIPPGFHESLATFPRINLVKEIDAVCRGVGFTAIVQNPIANVISFSWVPRLFNGSTLKKPNRK